MEQTLSSKKFDLEERTARFGEGVINLCKKIQLNPITSPLVSQLVRSGTSVGANYSEADDAESKRDFRHKIGISKKEARESVHFLRMLTVATPDLKTHIMPLLQEAKELNLILNAIYRKVK